MKLTAAIIGSLLVATGVLAPAAVDVDEDAAVAGDVVFHLASSTGRARANATDAAFLLGGEFGASFRARDVTLTVYEYGENCVCTYIGHERVGQRILYMEDPVERRFTSAVVRVEAGPKGELYTYSNETLGDARFDVAFGSFPMNAIKSIGGSTTWSGGDTRFEHVFHGPFFGYSQNEQRGHLAYFPRVEFGEVHVTGAASVFAHHANLTIDHDGGRDTVRLGEWEESGAVFPAVPGVRRAYAVLSVEGLDAAFTVGDATAHFLSHDPVLHLNGTVAFSALEGRVAAGDADRALREGDAVELVGNVTLALAAPPRTQVQQILSEDPLTKARLSGDAGTVTVNGAVIRVLAPPAPSTLTLVEIAMGAILVAWSLVRWLFAVVVGLRVANPLENAKRRGVYDEVVRVRLIHLRALQRATGLRVGTLAYHLAVLRRAGLLATVTLAGYRVYYVPRRDVPRDVMERVALLAEPTRRRIAEVVVARHGASQRDLGDALGLTLASISRQLSKMESAGLVERRGLRNSQYFPSALLRDWMPQTIAAFPPEPAQT